MALVQIPEPPVITERYAAYNDDAIAGMAKYPDECVHLSIYSPAFGGLYNYSSDDRDLSNCKTYPQFLDHYRYMVKQVARLTIPGRCSLVHVADVPNKGRGQGALTDFPGDVIRMHEDLGFDYAARFCIWKEPLKVAIRTRALSLRHSQLVKDTSKCTNAGADYLLLFRKRGTNPIPIAKPEGLSYYAGSTPIPEELLRFRNWPDPKTNKLSHWIWQHYASSFWDDIRVNRVLPYRDARESEEEKHPHPLQLDVIERATIMWSNVGETVLTPCAGVGSELYMPCALGRKAVGWELKPSYFRQLVRNMSLPFERVNQSEIDFYEEEDLEPEDDNEDEA